MTMIRIAVFALILGSFGACKPTASSDSSVSAAPMGCAADSECGAGRYCWRPMVPGTFVTTGNCETYAENGGKCVVDHSIYQCAAGLTCNFKTKLCEKDPAAVDRGDKPSKTVSPAPKAANPSQD